MTARTPLLLATTALLGCPQINNDCSEFNPFFCVKDIPVDTTGETGESTTTTNVPTTTESTSTSESSESTGEPPTTTETTNCTTECGICGDGIQDANEDCDEGVNNEDGEWSQEKHCNSTCDGYTAYCGDKMCDSGYEDKESCPNEGCLNICGNSIPEPGEECDESKETATCDDDCTKVTCGDSKLNVTAGEICDKGSIDTVDCDGDCTIVECGDMRVNDAADEECDDGNDIPTDSCIACKAAVCGDGIIRDEVEECDDGNINEDDGCDSACKIISRLVFVSSDVYDGDLGGLSGADSICTALAVVAGYKGKFRAWLSNETDGPIDRMDDTFNGVYRLANGTPVADGWSGLTTPPLKHAINRSEMDIEISEGSVWTNTNSNGMPISDKDCGVWDSGEFVSKSTLGNLSAFSDEKWTKNTNNNQACNGMAHLYCFEDQ